MYFSALSTVRQYWLGRVSPEKLATLFSRVSVIGEIAELTTRTISFLLLFSNRSTNRSFIPIFSLSLSLSLSTFSWNVYLLFSNTTHTRNRSAPMTSYNLFIGTFLTSNAGKLLALRFAALIASAVLITRTETYFEPKTKSKLLVFSAGEEFVPLFEACIHRTRKLYPYTIAL